MQIPKDQTPSLAVDLVVVVPAYNEESYLPDTLGALSRSLDTLPDTCTRAVVVVDDQSDDGTAAVARKFGAIVVVGRRVSIGAARNAGAAAIASKHLIFLDADTVVELGFALAVYKAFEAGARFGAVAPIYESQRILLKPLFKLWSWYGPRKNMTQGVCQFIRTSDFMELGGYDESLRMAEDSDLGDRAFALVGPELVAIITGVRVHPSMRRYEHWSSLRAWFWTNPLTTRLFRKSRSFWSAWYDKPPR